MPESNTKVPVRLPVFKDKVMYISPNQNKNKIEQSYVISASFKGILRLSPNNYNTIYENNPVELTNEQDAAMSSSYSDAIVFDDSMLVDRDGEILQESTKTNADIRQRMIIGSDSDGYLVDFRISAMDVEFDNLGVIGITKTNDVTIYTNELEKESFIIGNTSMPILSNSAESNRQLLIEILNQDNDDDIDFPENYDEIQIDITGEGDKSYLLHGTPNENGNRSFTYKRSQQFIRDVILETLLSFQSVPTGSIHWFPVTYEQYENLIKGHQKTNLPDSSDSYSMDDSEMASQCPNRYFKYFQNEMSDIPADPIIRDYLLCDGRKYKTEDFPELAKILLKENITYWDAFGKIQKEKNGELLKNDETGMTNYPKYFRVPDLRAKFISYCNAASSLNSLDEEAYDIHQHKSEEWNTTGLYTPDNSPLNPILHNQEVGEHFHFLAYGTYNGYNTAGRNSNMYNFKTYTVNNGCDGIKSSSIWYLQTSAGSVSYPDGEGGYSYGFGCSGNRRRGQSSVDSITACAYVSAPSGGDVSYLIEPTLGLTSKSIPIYQIPKSNEETYKKTEYEEWSDYNNLKSGISKNIIHLELDKDSILPQRYGFENAPKFYTFLPLIRI